MGQTSYEAEDATLSGPTYSTEYPGYSGSGYADYQNATGDYVQFALNADSSGTYPIAFRYANGGASDRPLELRVNGVVVASSLSFPPTSGWANWSFTATNNVMLNAGLNTVRLTATGSSGANVDYMLVTTTGTSALNPNAANAPLRRPISPNQPMWLIHIDTWNYPDPQKIIDLIPQDIRPFVVMNISLSISHDTNSVFNIVQYGYETAKSWVRACAENNMWCMIQPASGGYAQFPDADLSMFEEFYRDYPNFIGFNYAEQFWGFNDPPLSPTWDQRVAHWVDLMKLNQKYGGYLVVSWCGPYWGAGINPIAMMKKNPAFAAICKQSPKNFILEEKYTSNYGFYDIESTCLGTYLSGFCGQYGIRYDNTGWVGYNANDPFHPAAASAPIIEHAMLTGETVMDGPEMIWNQDIQSLNNGTTPDGYTTRRWGLYPQFQNVSMDIFRKMLDGTIRIPSRKEVIDRTKVVIINDVTSGSDQDKYSSPQDLFTGLYLMTGDGTNGPDGTYLNQLDYFKKTGRYPAVPTVYQLADSNANTFQVQVNKSAYTSRWPSVAAKTNEFNNLFPQEYTGDIYAGRQENGWVIYNPYKSGQTASGSIPFKYNTCDHVDLILSQYTAGVMKEYSNSLSFYLNNFDTVNTGLVTDVISIYGSSAEPIYAYTDRASHQASTVTTTWSGGVFTLNVTHRGALDLTVNCAGTATDRLTNYTTAAITPPASPATYVGPHQYEAECFDYRNIAGYVANGYGSGVANYTGQGYLKFGTSSSARIEKTISVLNNGTYRLDTKYSVTGANVGTIDLYVNGIKMATPMFTQTATLSDWAINQQYIILNAGSNTIEFRANGAGASSVYFDNIVVVPTMYNGGLVIQENQAGFQSVDGSIDSNYSGFTGDGYANTMNSVGAGINWNLDFDSSVTKAFTFRYASTNDSKANLIINGTNVASDIQFASTESWTNWDYVTVYAYTPAGTSDVRLESTSAAGLPNIDYVEVVGTTSPPPPPSGVLASAGNAQVNLSWNAIFSATSYNVKRSTTSGSGYVTLTNIAATSFIDTGLTEGVTYYYVVSATNAYGESADSAEASATVSLLHTMTPVADAYVQDSTPTSNYGTQTDLLVKNVGGIPVRRDYLMFDVHALTNVQSATVTLTANRVDAPATLYYELVSNNWSETGITWNNQPGSTGVFLFTNVVAATGVAANFDVTSAVASQATNGGLLSIRISAQANTDNSLIQFYSRESTTPGLRPVLTYELKANTPPTLAAISNRTISAGMTLTITNSATDSDVPAQTLSYSLLTAPTNAVINTNSGVLTWRPLVTQANSTNPFTVMVADSGTPGMSVTQTFEVVVSPLAQPQFSTVSLGGGQIVLQVNGDSGPDYQVQTSTNLVTWSAVLTTNSPAMPFTWSSDVTNAPLQFFRIVAGPPFP